MLLPSQQVVAEANALERKQPVGRTWVDGSAPHDHDGSQHRFQQRAVTHHPRCLLSSAPSVDGSEPDHAATEVLWFQPEQSSTKWPRSCRVQRSRGTRMFLDSVMVLQASLSHPLMLLQARTSVGMPGARARWHAARDDASQQKTTPYAHLCSPPQFHTPPFHAGL